MLAVRMLGPLQVDGAHRLGPRDFGGIKPRQLLEILLAARGRAVPKERLAELLWGETQPRDAFATLETYVSGLRRRLGQTTATSDGLVVTETGAYRFAVDRVDLDLDRFDDLLAGPPGPPGRPAAGCSRPPSGWSGPTCSRTSPTPPGWRTCGPSTGSGSPRRGWTPPTPPSPRPTSPPPWPTPSGC